MKKNTPNTIHIDRENLPKDLRGAVVVIGNFDGFHRGHQSVISQAMAEAGKIGCPTILLTFEPHPRTWFNPDEPVYTLLDARQKEEFAAKLGCAAIAVHSFNKAFAALSADAFIDTILIEKLAARHIVIGHDFHFGSKRSGTPQFMVARGKTSGFGVSLVEASLDENGETISSSRIRAFLEQGELAAANGLLGYAYRISGEVIHGNKKGRTLGFPTANIALTTNIKLRHGIYAVRAIRSNGDSFDGVASYGRRPTFDNGKVLFETFLFDFNKDLYGEELAIILHARLRDELKFGSVDDLITQMKIDRSEAEQFLETLAPDHLLWPSGAFGNG